MEALSKFFALINPWAGLLIQAVTMAESFAAQASVTPTGAQKKSAAIDAVVKAITVAPAVGAEVVNLQNAIKTNDPETVATGIGHGIEMALSFCKAFGLFPKAGIVQNAAPLSGIEQPPASA